MGSRHHPMTGATEGRGWNPQTSDPNVRPLLPLRCPKGGPGVLEKLQTGFHGCDRKRTACGSVKKL